MLLAEFPRLETERLILRETLPADQPAIYRMFADPEVTRFHNQETFTRPAEARGVVESRASLFRSGAGVRWGVALKGEDALVGGCGLHNWNRLSARAELGYELARPYWGRGLMTEAARAVLAFGFGVMGLNRIEALVIPENLPSARLLRRLGFQEEGLLREYGFWKGAFHDLALFSLLRREWSGERSIHVD